MHHGRFLRQAFTFLSKRTSISSHTLPFSSNTLTTYHHHHLSLDTHSLIRHLISSVQSLNQLKQLHAFSILNGILHRSASIFAALMLNYATFGSSSTPSLLFHQTQSLNYKFRFSSFLWNTLIRAHCISGLHYHGIAVYNQMLRNGGAELLDDHTFPFVLKICADVLELNKGKEIHGLVLKTGFDDDVYVGNTLIALYTGANHPWEAQKVFEEMPERDIVTWNSIIVAFSSNGYLSIALDRFIEFKLASGLKPNSVSVVSILRVCAEIEDEEITVGIHGYVVKAGLGSYLTVANALINVYSKCGNLEASKRIFDEMVERNVISWNAIIAGFSGKGHVRDALAMFKYMVFEGEKPDSTTVSTLLPVLVELEFFNMGKEIHAYSIKRRMGSDVFVSNSLIDMYAKSGSSPDASHVFYEMEMKSTVTWNAMIANCAQNGLELEALRLVREMQVQGEKPNSFTFTNVLPACSRMGLYRQGKEIHAMTVRKGFACDLFISNALIDMYAKCKCLSLARNVFNISLRDEVSYNTLIVGYSHSEHSMESIYLFSEMKLIGLMHDSVSFMGVLSACANQSALKQGKEVHGILVRKLFHLHLFVSNSLLDMYTKCGQMSLARRVFDQIPDKDVTSWNCMIMGYGMQGDLDIVINLFDEMRVTGVKCDSVSYIAVLSACSHGGLVEKGRKYYEDMLSQDIKPTCSHYACMVDLLGRAGLLEEAAELVRGLPIDPDADVWGAMLGACRVHGNIDMGRWAAEHLFELKPTHSGYYLLLSNMYSEAGKWDEANKIRELMKSRGLKKNPGCSWVETYNQLHAFSVGEKLEESIMGYELQVSRSL